jgi:hypothetical protein
VRHHRQKASKIFADHLPVSFSPIRMQFIVVLASLSLVLTTDATTTTKATKLMQDICDTLYNNEAPQAGDDHKWETICQDLFGPKDHYEKNQQERQSNAGKY